MSTKYRNGNSLIPNVMFIGDIHGNYVPYAKMARMAEEMGNYTVQIGDFGFSYGIFKHYGLDPDRHMFFGGNHDNYETINACENNLGDFGEVILPGWLSQSFFYVRGAYSVDKHLRLPGKDWWPEEELNMEQCEKALKAYNLAKPDIMVTHDGPNFCRDWMLGQNYGLKALGGAKIQTRTGDLLQTMLDCHQPRLWIFGHWHRTLTFNFEKTKFVCLGELGWTVC